MDYKCKCDELDDIEVETDADEKKLYEMSDDDFWYHFGWVEKRLQELVPEGERQVAYIHLMKMQSRVEYLNH